VLLLTIAGRVLAGQGSLRERRTVLWACALLQYLRRVLAHHKPSSAHLQQSLSGIFLGEQVRQAVVRRPVVAFVIRQVARTRREDASKTGVRLFSHRPLHSHHNPLPVIRFIATLVKPLESAFSRKCRSREAGTRTLLKSPNLEDRAGRRDG
jgi:hypothetical protein